MNSLYNMSHESTSSNVRRKSVSTEKIKIDELENIDQEQIIIPKTDDQRKQLKHICNQIVFLQNLEEDQLNNIVNVMFPVKTHPGQKVITEGDEGDNFYIINQGIFKCFIKSENEDKLIHTYENSGYFGELALMYNARRSATVISETEGSLWAVDRKTFRSIVVVQTYNRKMRYDSFLRDFPIFKEMTAEERMNIADALMPKTFADNEIIIRQGDLGTEMYFIESGVVLITQKHSNQDKEISRLEKGQYFGELALLSNQPRQATAKAIGEVKCAVLDVHTFERLMGPCLDLMKRNIEHYKKQIKDIFDTDAS